MDLATNEPVLSALEAEAFSPSNTARVYRIAPLTYRQRSAMQRDIRRAGGIPVDRAVVFDVLRQAVRELDPANIGECLAEIDGAEATPEEPALQARIAVIEHAVAALPAYAAMQDAIATHAEERRWHTVRHALRGWSGPGLPPFDVGPDGLVPDDLLNEIPANEFDGIFERASILIGLGKSAEGNSAALSPSPESPAPTPAA